MRHNNLYLINLQQYQIQIKLTSRLPLPRFLHVLNLNKTLFCKFSERISSGTLSPSWATLASLPPSSSSSMSWSTFQQLKGKLSYNSPPDAPAYHQVCFGCGYNGNPVTENIRLPGFGLSDKQEWF